MVSKRKRNSPSDPASERVNEAVRFLYRHPMFQSLINDVRINRHEGNLCPEQGWAVVTERGEIHVHPTRRGEPEEWVYVLSHSLFHLCFDHFRPEGPSLEWGVACDLFIASFLSDLKLGRPPKEIVVPDLKVTDEKRLHDQLQDSGVPDAYLAAGTAGAGTADMVFATADERPKRIEKERWIHSFATGVKESVRRAVDVAGGYSDSISATRQKRTAAVRARSWFVNSYPLLGSLAASFRLVEDQRVCLQMEIDVAAVDAELREIYVNPAKALNESEARFVIAHELLHVGLRHQERRHGRDPEVWNVACDYVTNGWLVEMGVGELPSRLGGLYDPSLKGESVEQVYDRIATDMRSARKLATMAGRGRKDMLGPRGAGSWQSGAGIALDEYYRRCLSQGLVYHFDQKRGLLPAGLVEEINALSQPPIPWDVDLARWFDEHFPAVESTRSFARPSRRQASTPDIPRPSTRPAEAIDGRTFGVVLDTSGSMDRKLLAKALGAIASYSIARDVPLVRVVFCDAVAYDEGYLAPEAIAGRVKVRGRGGTILQPGIDLLERCPDFPKDGPLLIITDGECDRLRIRRDHAFLIPQAAHLPFAPRGLVFRVS